MRLLRPYIPLKTRCVVATRQIAGYAPTIARTTDGGRINYKLLLTRLLDILAADFDCTVADLQLDHNPALENRPFNKRTNKYTPDANDPDYLLYREKHAHKIKTLVRGDGALRSDAGQRRYNKRAARNRDKTVRKVKIRSRGFDKTKTRTFAGRVVPRDR